MSATLPLLVTVCAYVIVPPAVALPALSGEKSTDANAFTVTELAMVSLCVTLTDDVAVNETPFTPGAVPAGTSTRTTRCASAPDGTGPVETTGVSSAGSSIVLYLPKIQTDEEAALWNDILSGLEQHVRLPGGTIKEYVLVEQEEA